MLTITLAWRNLFRNVRRTTLTVMLIGFSLAAMILTDAVIIGMADVLVGSVTKTLLGEAQVDHKGFRDAFDTSLFLDHAGAIEKQIEASPSIAAWAPRVIAGGMVSSSYNAAAGVMYGVDAEKELAVSRIKDAVIEGSYLTGKPGEILIGNSMAKLLEVKLGDRIVITVAEPASGDLSQALFRVSGIFHFGTREFDDRFVFVNLAKAQQVLNMHDQVHQIAVQFKNPDDARNPNLPFYKNLNHGDVEAVNWLEINPAIASVLGWTNYSSGIVAIVLFLLASFGVINSMFMSIYERIYEIGVIKAIGTRPRALLRLVLTEAAMLALLGCVLGVTIGWATGSYFSDHGIPMGDYELSGIMLSNNILAVLKPYQFIEYPVYVILLTLVAAIYPARFASRVIPSEALHRSL